MNGGEHVDATLVKVPEMKENKSLAGTQLGENFPPNFLLFHLFADRIQFATLSNGHLGDSPRIPNIRLFGVLSFQRTVRLLPVFIHSLSCQLSRFSLGNGWRVPIVYRCCGVHQLSDDRTV